VAAEVVEAQTERDRGVPALTVSEDEMEGFHGPRSAARPATTKAPPWHVERSARSFRVAGDRWGTADMRTGASRRGRGGWHRVRKTSIVAWGV
jgi:hypothetical protein